MDLIQLLTTSRKFQNRQTFPFIQSIFTLSHNSSSSSLKILIQHGNGKGARSANIAYSAQFAWSKERGGIFELMPRPISPVNICRHDTPLPTSTCVRVQKRSHITVKNEFAVDHTLRLIPCNMHYNTRQCVINRHGLKIHRAAFARMIDAAVCP